MANKDVIFFFFMVYLSSTTWIPFGGAKTAAEASCEEFYTGSNLIPMLPPDWLGELLARNYGLA